MTVVRLPRIFKREEMDVPVGACEGKLTKSLGRDLTGFGCNFQIDIRLELYAYLQNLSSLSEYIRNNFPVKRRLINNV